LRKESIKKDNDKKPSHLEREIDLTNQKRNNFDEGIGKRGRRGRGADLGLNSWHQSHYQQAVSIVEHDNGFKGCLSWNSTIIPNRISPHRFKYGRYI
jgi:hypothetical protein